MKIVTVAEMQAIERESNDKGWTYDQMMEKAGTGLAEIVESFYGYEENRSVTGLVGSGNNGGDTLVALEILLRSGWKARAYLVRPRPKGDALLDRFQQAGGEVVSAEDDQKFKKLDSWLKETAVLLDGVLGTGIKLPLKEEVAKVLAHVKEANPSCFVVAVDCPSGVDLDSGAAADETIPAEVTVCMAAVKTGLLRFPARSLAGDLQVVDIGLPPRLKSWNSVKVEMVTEEMVRDLLPVRKPDSHKGTFGTVGVVAGSLNYTGAAYLCASAAYRIGAGLVQVAVPAPLHAALAGQLPEATWVLLPHDLGVINEAAVDVLARYLEKVDVLLLGPGFGVEDSTANFVRRLFDQPGAGPAARRIGFISAVERPKAESNEQARENNHGFPQLVIDADGLKLLARVKDWPKKLPELSVLTPHPGEMAILTGLSVQELQANRLEVARKYAKAWGHVVVLKGAMTVIAEPGGQVRVIPVATSALAHAGTGDVLAGMIAGLRAQKMTAFDAAVAAAWIHAQTGLYAAQQIGHEASVLAGDLIDFLPEVLSWVW